MGWQDYHLHEFKAFHPAKARYDRIGIPSDDFLDEPILESWKVKIATYFNLNARYTSLPAYYLYDFGDDWRHVVTLETVADREPGFSYPRCLAAPVLPRIAAARVASMNFSKRSPTQEIRNIKRCLNGWVVNSILTDSPLKRFASTIPRPDGERRLGSRPPAFLYSITPPA